MSDTNTRVISIRVGQLPGTIKTVQVAAPAKVSTVLTEAQINPAGYEIRVDSITCDINAEVLDGQTILLVKAVKGNARFI